MKFHNLSNEGGPSPLDIETGVVSHSDCYGGINNFSTKEESHSLPRPPPTINGSTTSQKYDSSNGTTHSKDGIELQQKKVVGL